MPKFHLIRRFDAFVDYHAVVEAEDWNDALNLNDDAIQWTTGPDDVQTFDEVATAIADGAGYVLHYAKGGGDGVVGYGATHFGDFVERDPPESWGVVKDTGPALYPFTVIITGVDDNGDASRYLRLVHAENADKAAEQGVTDLLNDLWSKADLQAVTLRQAIGQSPDDAVCLLPYFCESRSDLVGAAVVFPGHLNPAVRS